jgi:hypothetical protein
MRHRRRGRQELVLPAQRLVVPVLAATGGAGRSTVCHLLASRFATLARTLVLDAAPGLASPWQGWLTRPGTAPLPPGVTPTAQQVYAAAGTVHTGRGAEFSVLPGPQQPPVAAHRLQVDQARLLRTVSARVSLVDTTTAVLADLAGDDISSTGRTARADAVDWLIVPGAVSVLCVPASSKGVADALATVTAVEERGLAATQLHVAVVGIAASDMPRRVLAGLTLLQPRVGTVVRIPHDPRLRATSRPDASVASSRLGDAIDDLTRALSSGATRPQMATPPAD